MKHEPVKASVFAIAALAFAYIASYAGIRLVRPECINTNDGPIAAFTRFYHPLRYVDSEKPEWYSKTHDNWLEVRIDGNYLGNNCVSFTWAGGGSTAFYAADMSRFHKGDPVLVHFRYKLVTFDDFKSRYLPIIDHIHPLRTPQPN